jgi:hypothetical protein
MTVRADDGERFHGPEQPDGNRADLRIRGQEPVGIQSECSAHCRPMKWSDNIAIRR